MTRKLIPLAVASAIVGSALLGNVEIRTLPRGLTVARGCAPALPPRPEGEGR